MTTHTLLTLDARHPYTAKVLIDVQELHRTVMSGFKGWVDDGSPDARAQLRTLFNWTVDLRRARLALVVQSMVPGDWSELPRGVLAQRPESLVVDRVFRVGDRVDFRTVVNPVASRHPTSQVPGSGPTARTERGKRVALNRPEQVKAWFVRRLQPLGEPVRAGDGVVRIGVDTDPERLALRILPRVSGQRQHQGLKLARAELRGTLTVTDPSAFVTALAQGVGHGRAYGCGLILVR
ncbi:type I-E CRISPR-associated protein Cas6/Cse3/CasE [Kitasatospora fiedleri]|uniref:type I-E CRISPR-associated protein Cas6/Cse3/CasE n=1 Tax=Kitasatospora fiedleri TaxID=2991545 RepID=UPI00249C3BCF|nr:type I-E CRISPR-associated protein Cas6/Cse3/CasE [Kitasatospora fiedleri]